MIAERLKAARQLRKKSQIWVADEVGVTQSSVSLWELGKGDPTTENMERIAQALNINYHWLLTGEGDMYETDMQPATVITIPEKPVIPPSHAEQRIEFLKLFDQLSNTKRNALLAFMREWIK